MNECKGKPSCNAFLRSRLAVDTPITLQMLCRGAVKTGKDENNKEHREKLSAVTMGNVLGLLTHIDAHVPYVRAREHHELALVGGIREYLLVA